VSAQQLPDAGALIGALVCCAVYASGRPLYQHQMRRPRRWLSLAAGVSVAYVFVDLLPELNAQQQGFVRSAGPGLLFAEQRIYIAALIGFVFFYGLDHFVLAARPAGTPTADREARGTVYWFHLGGYALYSWLIGYLLVERATRGAVSLVLYGVAMALHLSTIAHGLVEKHERRYDHGGWWILAASLVAGWLAGVAAPLSALTMSRFFAFVAGGVVMTSMNDELPRTGQGRFLWFLLGATAYAIILLLA